uniref:Uncharacterized protein n=1 Tax=uncultured prokaryote TaxID=198431 RepID=A0A0H5Q7V0_9ZZZZ|nr:hypothetical protein [uncultured prokaryote]
MDIDQMNARRARDRAFHELRIFVTRSNHRQDRVVKVWHKPVGRDWQQDDFLYKSTYGPLRQYGDLDALISAAISALEELEHKREQLEL